MKTLKFLGSTVLLCLFVVACAKSKKEEQALITTKTERAERKAGEDGTPGGNSRDPKKARPAFDVTKEGYTSKVLVLPKATEGSDNKGQVEISDKDAMELYERLRIKAVVTDDSRLDDRYTTYGKAGKNLSCLEYTLTNEKEKIPSHKCLIKFDYRTGKVLQDIAVVIDEQTVEKTTNYTGALLTITPNKGAKAEKSESTALLSIKDADAKALFDTLSVEAKSPISSDGKGTLDDGWLQVKVKTAANIRCYETQNPSKDAEATYTCSLSIDANDGTVKESEKSTAAEPAAPADDGKDGDEPAADVPAAPATEPEARK